ncbi:mechanosensitive ion channel family protein [Mangrovimicrobium sediminis]|uniref:Small-conductance mechanosensitive channel n=1 Tax=Mangrovimicrobium sediminis TaxID=2562682 RepID=A0A4Z0M314_9GAMM|nr:mechanosensitive ion channel family protein [Haliea sp. SAOS-164]TGD73901.1 mechanosensitive ion channel family protein [Haliea sp. SAOS-164]
MRDTLASILAQLNGYGSLIATIIGIMFGGMIAVFALYKLLHSALKPKGTFARFIAVFFGALYVLILVITALVAAQHIGLPVEGLASVAILVVIIAAVVVFFLVPFLPRLPFVPGDMVEVRGEMGIVEAMTAYQVVLRNFDGQTVFIPTPLAMAAPIRNYTAEPRRRIQLDIDLQPGSDIERASELLIGLMQKQDKVLSEPAPSLFVTGVSGEKISMVGFCWAATSDWFAARDTLWRSIAGALDTHADIALAVPRLHVSEA